MKGAELSIIFQIDWHKKRCVKTRTPYASYHTKKYTTSTFRTICAADR